MNMKKFLPDENNVCFRGRTVFMDGARRLGYSCSGVELEFTGSRLTAEIEGEYITGEGCGDIFVTMLGVVVEGQLVKKIRVDNERKIYDIFSSDTVDCVNISLIKLSDSAFGNIKIFTLYAKGIIKPYKDTRPLIEFVGDSITCAFGNEGVFGKDNYKSFQQNPWEGYAAITARMLDWRFSLVSRSCIGVYSSSAAENADKPENSLCMPQMYEYADYCADNSLKWNFDAEKPLIIVVNLGTNDATFTKNIPERCEAFFECYTNFIKDIRRLNPNAAIILSLGAMGQELCPQIEKTADILGGEKCGFYTMRFDVQRAEDGIGAENHPSAKTHGKMAEKLVKFICDKNLRNGML